MNYLIVAAHPDDEVLGAGGYCIKLAEQGHQVAVAIMVSQAGARQNLSATLAQEQEEAMQMLGVVKTYHACFPNIAMNTVPHLQLVQFAEGCIADFQPDVLITHHPSDTNNDHVMTSYAVQAAFRIFQRRTDVRPIQKMLYMEVLSATEWALDSSSNRFTPNYFAELGKERLEKKLTALEHYKGVMRPYPHPRSREALEGLAAYRGAQAGCCYAEAFECVFQRD